MSRRNRPVTKDMYWFAHGGSEQAMMSKSVVEEENESNSLDHKGNVDDQKLFSKDISFTDGSNSSGPSSLERDDRLHASDKRMAVEERRKLLLEAEQERNDAVMRKHMEREAALEARRNAQRSTISFAFGSSIPRNIDTSQSNHSNEMDCMSRSFTAASSSHRVEDVMTRSMTASISASRGRRKNDLMPTVPYDRTAAPRVATSSSSRRRSVSMTRLDQLAQPRKHYVEATKANSTASSGTSSLLKDVCSPNRPLSSASEHSGGRAASNVTRRVRSAPRKPRPVSIAGTIPDQKHSISLKLNELKGSAIKKTPAKKTEAVDVKKTPSSTFKSSTPKSVEKPKPALRPTTAPAKTSAPKSTVPKPTPPKTVAAKPKPSLPKEKLNSSANSTKPLHNKTPTVNKKKSDVQVSAAKNDDIKIDRTEKSGSPLPDSDSGVESDKNNKRIISEEEAKAALAEKRRLAREQAEREAELERQRQEELRRQEEERLQREEEEQRKMEEESMRLLEEHRRQEEEKLRKAIEDQEQKKEEERARLEEESRLKAEQDRKAKEESEKIRLEMEEKLRREEEERAERKKRLEKIMSRTRGKSSGTSPSGSVSGSDHMDSGENQQEGFSSGANSLESNEGANSPSDPVSSDDIMAKMEVSSSGGNSLEANLTYEFSSNDVSLNSNDLMLPASEIASQENSMIIASNKEALHHESAEHEESSSAVTPINFLGEVNSNSDQLMSETKEKVDSSTLEEEKIGSEIDSVSQKSEEAEVPAINNTNEISVEDIKFEQKPIVSGESQKPNPFDDELEQNNELVKEEFHTSDFLKTENIQLNTEVLEQNEEMNQFAENNLPTTVSQSSEFSAGIQFSDVDHIAEMQDSNFNHDAYENIQENVSSTDNQITPSDHQNEMFTKDQEGFTSIAASGEIYAAIESKPDQSFEVNQDPFSDPFTQDQIFVSDDKHKDQDFVEQPREIGENLIIPNQTSSQILSGDDFSTTEEQMQFLEGNVFNVSSENTNSTFDGEAAHSENLHSSFSSNFVGVGDASEAFKTAAGMNGSVDNPFGSNFEGAGDASEAFESEKTAADMNASVDNPFANNYGSAGDAIDAFKSDKTAADVSISVDNPFVSNYISNETEQNIFSSQLGDYDSKESQFLVPEHSGFEDQNVDKSSNHDLQNELDNVTLIKQEGSEKYVGIISSIDNDHFSNSFPKLNEHLTNNIECASTTDSEDSSLDSNLSQVVSPEDSEKDAGLNNHTNSDHLTSSNNTDNPFMTQNHQNQSSIPQLGVGHYSEFEVYSNGHSAESSKMVADYGNSILSVENNIFENVGAIDKISSDPFLGKGSSNQISGNPFLMQEEQNPKVLMTSDFLN